MERPTRGEVVIAACCALLIVTSFLPIWARYVCSACPEKESRVGLWSRAFSNLTKLSLVLVVAVLVVLLLRIVIRLRLPWPVGRIYIGVGALITLLLVLALIQGPSDFGFGHTSVLEVSRGPLLLVAWLVGAGVVYGGFIHMRATIAADKRAARGPVVLR